MRADEVRLWSSQRKRLYRKYQIGPLFPWPLWNSCGDWCVWNIPVTLSYKDMFLDPASQVFSYCILPSFMRCLKAKISPRNFYASLFCLKSSEHSNNRHSENSTTTPHNPIHYLKPVHFKTIFVPECHLEPFFSLRLFNGSDFLGQSFQLLECIYFSRFKAGFLFSPSLHPHQGSPSLCGVCHSKLAPICTHSRLTIHPPSVPGHREKLIHVPSGVEDGDDLGNFF